MAGFKVGEKNREIATALRVSERSVKRWRRQWREEGLAGVAPKGSPGRPRLSDQQMAWLERELARGPLAHGWADQRWTLAQVKTVIGRLFPVLLHRGGDVAAATPARLVLAAARRAIERDDDAVELWKRGLLSRRG